VTQSPHANYPRHCRVGRCPSPRHLYTGAGGWPLRIAEIGSEAGLHANIITLGTVHFESPDIRNLVRQKTQQPVAAPNSSSLSSIYGLNSSESLDRALMLRCGHDSFRRRSEILYSNFSSTYCCLHNLPSLPPCRWAKLVRSCQEISWELR
jgi:hypothetical protein